MNEGALYLKCEPIIAAAAHRFCLKFPHMDYDEVRGEANLFALEAIRSYDPRLKTKIETWITYVIKRRLIDKTKRGFQANLTRAAFPKYSGVEMPSKSSFSLRRFMSEVSDDACRMIHLVVTEEVGRCALREIFLDLGWTKHRIEQAFTEIREALQ